jgi:tRNA(Arg) A34 adenosine deaminase TadA
MVSLVILGLMPMSQADFCAKNTAPGNSAELQAAFDSDTKAAYFVREGNTVYYSIQGTINYDPIWALFGTGWKPKQIYCNYYDRDRTKLSQSEKGIWFAIGDNTNISDRATDWATSKTKGTFRKMTMDVSTDLAALFPVPGGAKQMVSDIQSESASVKKDNGEYVQPGTRNIHRLYLATAFTILRKRHEANTQDGVVALVVDKEGKIISWGMKNPNVPCWHGESSAIMRLNGQLPAGCCIFSTLKPCAMCAALIHQASNGTAKAFCGQDDPGGAAVNTVLDKERKGFILDGNKAHNGARGILLGDKPAEGPDSREVMSSKLKSKFEAQRATGAKSTIDYITSPAASDLIKAAEVGLKNKFQKYQADNSKGNPYTRAVITYLVHFLQSLGLTVENLGG